MSVLVACRVLDTTIATDVEHVPIPRLNLRDSYDEALATWGESHPESWSAVIAWRGRPWGDLVNEAVAESSARAYLVMVLGSLARKCDAIAIWYAGFQDDVPVLSSPEEFEATVDAQLAAGELEPAARMVARR